MTEPLRPDPLTRLEMEAYIESQEPGWLGELGIPSSVQEPDDDGECERRWPT